MDDLRDIRDMYNSAWDAESGRLERHQLEADITWRYLDRHLPPSGRILEIGPGTGAYTFPLARRGYRITAMDRAEKLVTRSQAKADELGLGPSWIDPPALHRSKGGMSRDGFEPSTHSLKGCCSTT